jgi:hypothetical protein
MTIQTKSNLCRLQVRKVRYLEASSRGLMWLSSSGFSCRVLDFFGTFMSHVIRPSESETTHISDEIPSMLSTDFHNFQYHTWALSHVWQKALLCMKRTIFASVHFFKTIGGIRATCNSEHHEHKKQLFSGAEHLDIARLLDLLSYHILHGRAHSRLITPGFGKSCCSLK